MKDTTASVQEIITLVRSLKVTPSQKPILEAAVLGIHDLLLSVVAKSIEKDREIEALRQGIIEKMTNEELMKELAKRMSGPAVG
jgi:hypothetical protein